MADHEFLFALDLPAAGAANDAMLRDLVPRLLGYVGCDQEVLSELIDALRRGADVAAGRRCDVQFRARDGELRITIAVGGQPLCQIFRPIP